jgi:hypothetical protein
MLGGWCEVTRAHTLHLSFRPRVFAATLPEDHVMSLQNFINTNHDKLVAMTRGKVEKRHAGSRPVGLETKHGVHIFLDQLRGALDDEATRDPSGQAQADPPTNPDIATTAALHGHDLLSIGFSVDQVVHDYGDVCQAVTELAVELKAPISVADFHTMNRCLDNAIAAAVTAWSKDRDSELSATAPSASARDAKLRRLVAGAIPIFAMLRDGKIGTAGASVAMLGRHLEEMRDLLDGSDRADATPATKT